ncbi:HD-GYP domain-containing protein [Deinococcota bacterium DY0809b]
MDVATGRLYQRQLMEYAQDLARAYREIRASQDDFLSVLVTLVELKAPAARGHARRVAFWALRLNDALGRPLEPAALGAAARAHDVGKLALPDRVVASWVGEDDEGRELLATHPQVGASLLDHVAAFRGWIPWVRHHHERWDGAGFPDGLAGAAIPLGARIIAVANGFDYRMHGYGRDPAYTLAGTTAWLERQAGGAFDPELVEAFVAMPLEALWANRLWLEEVQE